MKPLYKQPLIEGAILASGIMCTVLLIHGIQNFIALGGKPPTSQIAQKTNSSDLLNVAAGNETGNNPNCPAGLGQTAGWYFDKSEEHDPFNDFFGKIYPSATVVSGVTSMKTYPDADNLPSTHDKGGLKLDGLFASPPTFKSVSSVSPDWKNLEYCPSPKNGNKASRIDKPILCAKEVGVFDVPVGADIKVPSSSYRIGGNFTGMVMYADASSLRLSFARQDRPGSPDGSVKYQGFNLYIGNITVDPGILAKYRTGNDSTNRTCMPEVSIGDTLGTALEGGVRLAFRDSGNLQPMDDAGWWAGKVAPDGGGVPGPVGDGTKLALNVTCKNDPDCLSNRCNINPPSITSKLCLQGILKTGDTCTDASQCVSNKCDLGSCANISLPEANKTISGTITIKGVAKETTDILRVVLKPSGTDNKTTYNVGSDNKYIFSVPPRTYEINAELVNDKNTKRLAGSDWVRIVLESNNITQDLVATAITSAVPAAPPSVLPPPPAAGLPDWVNTKYFCIDTSKQSLCGSQGLKGDTLYCGTSTIDKLLPLVKLNLLPGYKEVCKYGGVPYLEGTRSVTVTEGTETSFDGVNYCVYTARDQQGNSAVCAGNSNSCRDICDFKGSSEVSLPVRFTIRVNNATGISDDQLVVESIVLVKTNVSSTTYNAIKSNNLEWIVDIPYNQVILNGLATSINMTIRFHTQATTVNSPTFTQNTYLALPFDKPEFEIELLSR